MELHLDLQILLETQSTLKITNSFKFLARDYKVIAQNNSDTILLKECLKGSYSVLSYPNLMKFFAT